MVILYTLHSNYIPDLLKSNKLLKHQQIASETIERSAVGLLLSKDQLRKTTRMDSGYQYLRGLLSLILRQRHGHSQVIQVSIPTEQACLDYTFY